MSNACFLAKIKDFLKFLLFFKIHIFVGKSVNFLVFLPKIHAFERYL